MKFLLSYTVGVLLLLITTGCHTEEKQFYSTHYVGITDADTAHLKITVGKGEFFGTYEIKYGNTGRDIGEVRGKVLGDTLKGVYTYKPFGGGQERKAPFAALRDGKNYRLGKGVETSYMNIPYYLPSIPINYSTGKFVFIPVNSNEAK